MGIEKPLPWHELVLETDIKKYLLRTILPLWDGKIETIEHVPLFCQDYSQCHICSTYNTSLQVDFPGRLRHFYALLQLSDRTLTLTFNVTKFCVATSDAGACGCLQQAKSFLSSVFVSSFPELFASLQFCHLLIDYLLYVFIFIPIFLMNYFSIYIRSFHKMQILIIFESYF